MQNGKIAATNRELPDLQGHECIGALDYASIRDFAACGLLLEVRVIIYGNLIRMLERNSLINIIVIQKA